jgi:hypothetical protein
MKVYENPDVDLSFQYPDNWTIEQEQNVVSLLDPENGLGALQFSVYQIPGSQIISVKTELEDYLKDRHSHFEVSTTDSYALSDYLNDKKGNCWKYWMFLKNHTLVFATYNCLKNVIGKESKYIDQIIGSLIEDLAK